MKKLLLVSLCFLMLCITQVFAQNRTVTGTVTAKEDGLPIPGVTVKVKGTNVGTQTNTAGKYTLSVPEGATLTFTFIGYETLTVPATGATINASLTLSSKQLGEVIVTGALGIKRAEKENGYASTTITAKDLTQTNVTNIANGLTAKVAGLAIATVDNSIDPQIRITLRGNRSLAGNNTALIVVDGIPIPGGSLSSINPDDVESSTILKGAGAAALYGSEASNGAIIITTKKGSGAKPTITYDNSVQLQQVGFFPKLQSTYGNYGGEPNYIDPLTGFTQYVPYENQLYGPAFDGSIVQVGAPAGSPTGPTLKVKYSALATNPIKSFFNTGVTEQNTFTFSQGDSKSSFYMSAQNVYAEGVIPGDKNVSTRVSIRGSKSFDAFKADYSLGYTRTNISTYGTSYTGSNLYSSIIQWPAFLDIKQFKDPNSTFANPSDFYDAYAVNPYWITSNSRINKQRDIFLGNLKLTYSPTKWLDASYQVANSFGIDQERYTRSQVNFSQYSINDPFGAGNIPSGYPTGLIPGQVSDLYQYGDGTGNAPGTNGGGYSRVQGDAVLNFHHDFFKDLKTNLIVGNTVWEQFYKAQFTGSNNLLIQNFYNINTIGGVPTANEGEATVRQIAYFGELSLGYKGYLFLDGTLRNEQDSRLPAKNRSFTYPSAKVSFIPTDAIAALKDNKIINYAKLYLSLSKVGNVSVGPYELQNTYSVTSGFPYGSLGALSTGAVNYSPNLKPESIKEIELGAEFSFFDSRLHATATYYKQNSTNQTLTVNTSASTGYSFEVINAGEIQSSGEEFELTGQILTPAKNNFGWTVGGNLSINDSKVVSLLPGISSLQLGNNVFAVVGQPFPVYKGSDFNRDPQGHVVVDGTTGLPSTNPNLINFGRTTPKYILGVNTQLSYKFVSLSAVAEYRGGNIIYNAVGSTLNFGGSSEVSASAGRERFIYPNSVIQTSPGVYVPNTSVSINNGNYGFWQSSAYNTTNSPLVSSAAFWKIREVALNFKLDQFIKKSGFIKGLTVALTGRNLALWTPKSNPWGDPEFADTVGNGIGTTSSNQTPGTRLFGGDIKVTF